MKQQSILIMKIYFINGIRLLNNEKINKFTTEYEKNIYLIISVIHNEFDVFDFLLKEKSINIGFRNSNGWNVINLLLNIRFNFN